MKGSLWQRLLTVRPDEFRGGNVARALHVTLGDGRGLIAARTRAGDDTPMNSAAKKRGTP